jgi:hypothetical protein
MNNFAFCRVGVLAHHRTPQGDAMVGEYTHPT